MPAWMIAALPTLLVVIVLGLLFCVVAYAVSRNPHDR